MLAGAIVAVALFAMAMAGVSVAMHGYVQTTRYRTTTDTIAKELAKFNSAALLYFTQTVAATSGETVTVSQLIADGELPSTFAADNGIGQQYVAMYGGGKRVIAYFNGPSNASGAERLGVTKNTQISRKMIQERIALDAASYTTGEGNVVPGWVVAKANTVTLPMGAGGVLLAQSMPNWQQLSYTTAAIMDNFSGLGYGNAAPASAGGAIAVNPSGGGNNQCPMSNGVQSFSIKYTSSGSYTYTVPQCSKGVTITATLKGAIGGGQDQWFNYAGYMVGSFSAKAGDTLTIIVGGMGSSGVYNSSFRNNLAVGGGGGLSGILLNGTPEVVAYGGGGGGGGRFYCGPQYETGGKGYGAGAGERSWDYQTRSYVTKYAASGTPFGAGGKATAGGSYPPDGGFGGGGAGNSSCGGGGGGYPGGRGGYGWGGSGANGQNYAASNVSVTQKSGKFTYRSGGATYYNISRPSTYSGAPPNGYVYLTIQ